MGPESTPRRFAADRPDGFVVAWIGMRLNHGALPRVGLAAVGGR
jgi:hypothetical protein